MDIYAGREKVFVLAHWTMSHFIFPIKTILISFSSILGHRIKPSCNSFILQQCLQISLRRIRYSNLFIISENIQHILFKIRS